MHFERQQRQTQPISLTPLIDVVFLLIVFFMLSTSFTVSESIELSMPQEDKEAIKNKDIQEKVELSRITIIDKNLLYMDGEAIALPLLRSSLDRLLEDNSELKVVVETAKDVSVQQLVDIMDMVYLLGGRHLSIAKWQPQTAPQLEQVDVPIIGAPSDMELGRAKAPAPRAHPSGFLRLPGSP